MMKSRVPVSFTTAVLSALPYVVFTVVSYTKNPLRVCPFNNWLSDLGNQVTNPQGAIFYNVGVILCAVFLAIWFTAGLSQWKLKEHIIQQSLLSVTQGLGALTAIALMMSALYPINCLKEHAFWSDINFILFGISFAFSVAALRYHSNIPKVLIYFGGVAAILSTVFLVLNDIYWIEWAAISVFIIYILSIGITSYIFRLRSPNPGSISI